MRASVGECSEPVCWVPYLQTAIVTGANSGLGKESAYELLRKGAHVVLACRSVERGEQAVQDLKLRDAKPDDVVSAAEWKFDVMALDVGSPYSIRAFVRGFNGRRSAAMVAADAGRESDAPPLHILLLNAGVFHVPYRLTDFQVESHFAVNHVGNQMLTQMLRPNLDRAVAGASGGVATVTVVSSATVYAADTVSLSIDDLNGEDGYSAALRYAESKLASALFTKRLARIWKVWHLFNFDGGVRGLWCGPLPCALDELIAAFMVTEFHVVLPGALCPPIA